MNDDVTVLHAWMLACSRASLGPAATASHHVSLALQGLEVEMGGETALQRREQAFRLVQLAVPDGESQFVV